MEKKETELETVKMEMEGCVKKERETLSKEMGLER